MAQQLNAYQKVIALSWRDPRKIVTDKLRGYGVAHRELMPDVFHDTSQYANSRVEQSHEATRVRERVMRGTESQRFKSTE
jgi:putative transposase